MRKKAFSFVSLTFLAVVLISAFSGYGEETVSILNAPPMSSKIGFEPEQEVSGIVEGGGGCPMITPGEDVQTIMSSITAGTFRDWCFMADAEQSFEFSTCPPEGSAAFDTILDARNADGATLLGTEDDSPGCGLQTRLRYLALSPGQYRIRVRGFQAEAGNFTLAYRTIDSPWAHNARVPVPNGLSQTTTVAYGGLLYTIGGGTGAGPTARINQVWAYDPSDDSWTRLADIPLPNGISAFGSAAVYGDYIYVFGGVTVVGATAQIYNTTYIYDILNDTWSRGADMPAMRFGSAVGVIGDKIYVAGGGDTMIRDTLWEYDPQKDTFAVKAPLPTPAFRIHGATVVNNDVAELHVFSAFPQGTSHMIYNALTNTWRALLVGVPFGVIDPAVVKLGDLIYVLGGISIARTQIYNPANGTWTQGPELPGPVSNTSGDAIDNVIYVIGGFDSVNSTPTNFSLTID